MKIDVRKKDVVWSYIGTFMSLTSNIVMLPFMLYFLDGDTLGIWYIFTSIGAIATLFDFGFGVTFARNITYCWSGVPSLKKENVEFADNQEVDYQLMKHVLIACQLIYLVIAGIALLLLSTVGTGYILLVSHGLDRGSYLIAWIIYVAATFFNLYYGYYTSFLRGVGAVEQANKNTVIARIIQIVSTIVLLFCGMGLTGACVAYLLYGTVFRILGKRKFYGYKDIGKHLKATNVTVEKEEMKTLFFTVWHNAWREGVITICNYLSNQASTLICSMFFTLSETGIYSLNVQIATAISTIAAALYSTYQPALQAAYVKNDTEKIRNTMSLIVVMYILIFVAGLIGAITIGLPILHIIKPEMTLSVPILLGLSLYQFILKFRNCYTSYFSCTNRICYVSSFIFASILCVILSLLFIKYANMGIWGMIIAQIISQAVYNMWAWPLKVHKEIQLPFFDMFIRTKTICLKILITLSKNRRINRCF